MSTTSYALEVVDLKKSYAMSLSTKRQEALRGITCRFVSGRITAVLGHNGAGKTTAMRVVLGLAKADAGQVLVFGAPLSLETRRRIGYMPEVSKLPPNLSPRELLLGHLCLYAGLRASARVEARRVDACLERLGLVSHSGKTIRQLSKGLGRRVAWALATVHEPELIILDEPFSGLDPASRRQMLTWIEEFAARGKTLILCTHELDCLPTGCEHFYFMRRGAIVLSHSEAGPRLSARSELRLVSSQGAAGVERWRVKVGLPAPAASMEQGKVVRLFFRKMEDAHPWLASAATEGVTIAHFAPYNFFKEDELLAHFV